MAELNAVLQDNLSGMREIQVFNQQSREKSRVENRARNYTTAILRGLHLSAIYHPAVEALTAFGTVIVVGFGGYLALNGILNVSDIIGFILYLNLFYQPIGMLARVTEDLQQAIAGADRVFEILDTDPDIKDAPGAVNLKNCAGNVRFEHVCFHYEEDKPVLHDISFTAKWPDACFSGSTGSAKPPLSAITRFYDPVTRQYLPDDYNPRILLVFSDQISIVLQDVFLFHGNVAENIATA